MNRKQRRAEKKQAGPTMAEPSPAVQALFADAVRHHQGGRLSDAERIYWQILAVDPGHADSLHLLGVIAHQLGRNDVAVDLIGKALARNRLVPAFHMNLGIALQHLGRLEPAAVAHGRALALRPDYAEAHSNLGNVLRAQGRLDAAAEAYGHALALKPGWAEAHFNLALALQGQGKLEAAVAAYGRALALKPDYAEAHSNLGNTLQEQGRIADAVDSFRRALALNPRLAEALSNLGSALAEQGQLDEAVAACRQALALQPDLAAAHGNLAVVLQKQGQLDEAVAAGRQALARRPDDAAAHYNLGIALQGQGKPEAAEAAYRQALTLKLDLAAAHSNLGNVLKDQGRLDDAVASYGRALALRPDYADAHYNLGIALKDRGALEEAIASYGRALALKPDYADAHHNLGVALQDQGRLAAAVVCFERALALKPDHVAAHSSLLLDQHYAPDASNASLLAAACRFGGSFDGLGETKAFANDRTGERRLRIGYVSADFNAHPVGYFLARVLPAHDRASVDVFCYANGSVVDALTKHLRGASDHWRSIVGLSDEDAAARIARDRIDVLIDLSGHTGNNRLRLFAMKPAPVQASWLGYFGTTGLTAIDYIIADRWVLPPGEENFFTETVWRLPDCYLCFAPPDGDVPITRPPRAGASPLTLGCFNNWIKISTDTDIAFDPLPFGGGTTTAEALWMGVPVVTLRGDRWVGRMSESILAAVGLPELVAATRDGYVKTVVDLANDSARLGHLHGALRAMVEGSAFCDGPRFTRALEAAYRGMWQAWCGAAPTA
jgi:protein O-GlcNAc transferase